MSGRTSTVDLVRRTAALAVLVVVMAGCSQTAALAPVGGNRLSEVRFAALDELVSQGVELLTAPVCTASGADDATISCAGETVDNEVITVSSPAKDDDGQDSDDQDADDQDSMDITIGPRSVFSGSVTDVLDRNARPEP